MTDHIEIHERLATLEAGILYGNKRLDAICSKLDAPCPGNCQTAKDLIEVKESMKVYKRITWVNIAAVLTAAAKIFWPTP